VKPHEETWTSDGERVELCEDQPPYGSVVVKTVARFLCHAPDDCTEAERALLAAQAPAMARLLLELEWAGHPESTCPACGRHSDGLYGDPPEHAPDCRLVAVLRAAGVLNG
jgi:hypothetical protein